MQYTTDFQILCFTLFFNDYIDNEIHIHWAQEYFWIDYFIYIVDQAISHCNVGLNNFK